MLSATRLSSKPPAAPRWGQDEPGPRERLEDLGEEVLRDLARCRQRVASGARPGRQGGQVDHHTNCVIGGASQLHGTNKDKLEPFCPLLSRGEMRILKYESGPSRAGCLDAALGAWEGRGGWKKIGSQLDATPPG